MITSALYHGDVMHHRYFPKNHRFVYRLTSWMIDIDELPKLHQQLHGFGYNRPSLFSFYDRDYGFADGRSSRDFINDLMLQHNLPIPHKVTLLCQVRAFGYLFNPLVVWFCYNKQGNLIATLYEVRNTFKQRHHYLVPVTSSGNKHQSHLAEKCFYVSPFMPMDCTYRFRFKAPDEQLHLAILQHHNQQRIMTATWRGVRERLTQKTLLMQVIRNPVSTVKIIVAIHWEALRLWAKGLSLITRPPPPKESTTQGYDIHQSKKVSQYES